VPAARVSILDGLDAGKSALTGADGRYRIENLAAGGFSVQASAADFDAVTLPVVLGDGPGDLGFRLTRAPCAESTCNRAPAACNETLPLFTPPFDGVAPLIGILDHHYPRGDLDTDPDFVSYCGGGNVRGGLNGFGGYDWALDEGTPVLAVADGTIQAATTSGTFYCDALKRDVEDVWTSLEVRSPYGERFWVHYYHLSKQLASSGEAVRAGQVIALSGSSGCSRGPQLFFRVYREFGNAEVGTSPTTLGLVDPYGWQGPGRDPWSLQPSGSVSAWLWIQPPRSSAAPRPGSYFSHLASQSATSR
jgi:hypothetical protein